MKRWFILICLAVSAVCTWMLLWIFRLPDQAAFFPARFGTETLLIDAGHGGLDGGAVSDSGTVESTINLAIALKLDQLAGFYGVPDVLIRTDEDSIHNIDAKTIRAQKRSDLENRVALINGTTNGVLISIHQNMHTGGGSSGAQVFYRDTASLPWAVHTQELLRLGLDEGNSRQAAEISDSVYLMSHTTCPAILVECGFLSNQAEEALLVQDSYQCKISVLLLGSYLTRDALG